MAYNARVWAFVVFLLGFCLKSRGEWCVRVVNKSLVIVFVTNNYTPYRGGVVSSIKACAQALRQLGHRVVIITLDFRGVYKECDVVRVACPLRFVYKDNQMAVPWHATRALGQIFSQINPDIVHIHHPFLLGYAALRVCLRVQLPVVFTHHTQYEHYLHYVPLPMAITQPVVRTRVSSVCQRVNAIIVPSVAIKAYIQEYGMTSSVVVVPSPLQDHFAKQLPVFIPKKVHARFRLLYVGRFAQEKNISVLLDLMSLLDSRYYCLKLVGYGYFEQQLKHYAYSSLKLSHSQVCFIRSPCSQRLCLFYRSSDLFVFSSQTETQGLVLAESMAAGTPVVALHGAGQDELVINGVNGFLVNNCEHMAERIEQIAHDRELFEHLQREAWQTSHHFHADQLAHKLLQVYHSTIVNKT